MRPSSKLVRLLTLLAATLGSAPAQQARPSRIAPNANLEAQTRLPGHRPAWANADADAGSAEPATPIRLTVLLARTPTLQAAFEQRLADQQNPASPQYHRWLTPQQIGEQFGPAPDEIAAVTSWLTSRSVQVASVSPSRLFIEATTDVATASAAFSTGFDLYTLNGEQRLAPTAEPAIPAAFAAVVRSIEGLADIPFRSYHTLREAPPQRAEIALNPQATSSSGTHYVFPGDFARIYNVNATTSAGYDGSGIKVAIAGQSRITTSDITQLQAMAGLPTKAPNTILIPNSADPGLVKGDEDESTLDVLRVLTTAPGAQADLVIAATSAGGVSSAIQYEINTLLDPILSISYGSCETTTSASSVAYYNTLFSQAAAEGISTFVSSGDSGAAGCSQAFTVPTGREATAMGNYLCSSSYVTCLGGTEFADAGTGTTFWSAANSSTYVTALGYIPEGAWNEPSSTSSTGVVTYQIAGSGSGPSAFIPKPSWQTGTGVPADGARDTPDISFSAANHDGYFACLAYIGSGGDCSRGGGVIFSGTSATAPSMAAIAALLNQRTGASQGNLNPLLYRLAASTPAAFHDATPASSGVATCTTATASLCNNSVPARIGITGGLAGYPLQTGYDLVTGLGSLDVTAFLNAAATPIAASTVTLTAPTTSLPAGQSLALTATVAAGATTVTPTGTVQFTGTGGSIATTVQLASGKAAATATFAAPGTYTVAAAYSGDGSFQPGTSSPLAITVTAAPTTVTVTANPTFLAAGGSAIFTVRVATALAASATGTVQFYSNGAALGSPVTLAAGVANTASIPFPTTGTYAITAVYSGDANNLAGTSNAFSLVVAALGATATTLTAASTAIIPGTTSTLTAKVTGNSTQTPTGAIQFLANGIALATATLAGGSASASYSIAAPGTYTLTAVYAGDTSNAASTSAPLSVTIAKYTTTAALTATATTFSTAQSTVVSVTLPRASSSAPAPGGSIQLFANGSPLGNPIVLANQTATSASLLFPAAGTYALTANYTGDSNYSAATLSGPALTVNVPTIAIASSPASLSVASGASTGNTSSLTVSSPNGYNGTIALTCAITSTPASASNVPTCALAPSSLTMNGASAATVLTLSTTVPHAAATTLAQLRRLPITLAGLGLLLLPFGRRLRRLPVLALVLLLPAVLTLTGCSASLASSGAAVTSSTPTLVGTTSGAYTVTITATPATGAAVSTTITLTVQ